MPTRIRRALQVLVFIPLLSTCGGGADGDLVPAKLVVALAPPVTVQNGVVFPIKIQVAEADGTPVDLAGIPVTLSAGGGRSLAGTTTANTDGQGVAHFDEVSLSGPVGNVQITATAPELAPVMTGQIGLTAGLAAHIVLPVGLPAQLQARKRFPVTPLLGIVDSAGNPVDGVTIQISITMGDGVLDSLVEITTRNVQTNANGQVPIGVWYVGTQVGLNRVRLTVPSVPSVLAESITVKVIAGPFDLVQIFYNLSGIPQVDVAYPAPFRARSVDVYGNPVAGVAVHFRSRGDSGGSMSGTDGITDSTGVFTLGSWHSGIRAGGGHFVVVDHSRGSAEMEVSVGPGPFSRVLPSAPFLWWYRNSAVTFGVLTVDRFGNRVKEIPLHAVIVSGGGSLIQPETSGPDGDFGMTLSTPATAQDVEIRVESPAAPPDSGTQVTVHVVAPASLTQVGPDSQAIAAGDSIPADFAVIVRDDAGNPVEGVPVVFGGFRHDTTDAAGRAEFPSVAPTWLGNFTYHASSPWIPDSIVTWAIQTVVGPPARMDGTCCGDYHAEVGTNLPRGQGVRLSDRVGLPVPGAMVHFATSHGTIAGQDVVTDSLGFAYPTDWVMDTIAGTYSATASTAGLPDLEVPVTADPGKVTDIVVLPGHAPEGFANDRIAYGVTVMAHDRYGNAPAGRAVTLIPPVGGSLIPLFRPKLDSTGTVYLDGWNFSPTAGTQQLSLSIDTLQFQFAAEAKPANPFEILLRGVPAEFGPVFRQAAYQWRRRITADIPDLNHVTIPGGVCGAGQSPLNDFLVDDLIIDVSITDIDGPGGILGAAGPCFIRTTGKLPLLGLMQLDVQDLAVLRSEGTLGDVILHEMGHVLGIGSMWPDFGMVTGAGTADPQYTGPGGEQGWAEIGGAGSVTVPVENTGGQGTADSHWRETSMPSELMTGYLSALVNPMSRVTVRSLGDLGYAVDPATADAYTAFTVPRPAPGFRGVRIRDRVTRPAVTVDPDGRARPIQRARE